MEHYTAISFIYYKHSYNLLITEVNTFFKFEMNMGREEPMIKCHEKAEEVNYCWKIKVYTALCPKLLATKVNILYQNQDLYKHFCLVS